MARLVGCESRDDVRWVLDDSDIDLAIRQISQSDIQSLSIDGLSDFGINDLSFLKALPDLKSLWVWSKIPIDISAIGVCKHLEELSLDDQISVGFDLEGLRHLRNLRMIVSKHQGLCSKKMPSLKSLWLWKSTESDLNFLSSFPNIERLGIFDSKKLLSLNGISNCKNLKRLDLGYCSLLSESAEMKTLSQLTHLELTSLKRLVSFVDNLPKSSLRKLIVDGLPPISDASIFLSFPNIELLTLIKTELLHGDLSPILQIGSLKHCNIRPNKSQYHPKASALYDMVKAKVPVD